MSYPDNGYQHLGRAGEVGVSRDPDGVIWLTYRGQDTSYEAAMYQDNPWDRDEVDVSSAGTTITMPVWELIHDIAEKGS